MNSCLIVGTLLDETSMNTQVTRKLGGWHHRIVSDDDIASAIIQDANDGTIVHRPTSQITHSLASTLAEEIATFQCWQCCTNLLHLADSWQRLDFIIHQIGDVDGDVAAITLCPSILPEITCYLSNLIDLLLQGRTTFQYATHDFFVFSLF